MRVAILGASGAFGLRLAAECARRGMGVTALCLPDETLSAETASAYSGVEAFSASADALRGFDAVVEAELADAGDPAALRRRAERLEWLTAVLKDLPEVRLLTVGGTESLFLDGERAERIADTLPPAARLAAEEAEAALGIAQTLGARWTQFSPAARFEPDGPACGAYILGRDIRVLNAKGENRLSYADGAAALADELEHARFCGKRFTAASDASACPRALDDNLIDLRVKYMFTRRGAYFGISSDVMTRYTGLDYASARLYIGTRRGTSTGNPEQGRDLVYLTPMYRGEEIAYAVRTTPTELILTTAYGEIRACMADDHLMLIRGENGLSLLLHGRMRLREQMKPRGAAAWEGVFRWRCSLMLSPLTGTLTMDAPWDGETQTTPRFRGVAEPDGDGSFLLAVDESIYAGKLRPSYPTYAEALADVTADWESFLEKIPPVDPALENARLEAAWNLWAFLLNPSGFVRHQHIMMAASSIASSWQMNHNAAALRDNLPVAMDLLVNMLDWASPVGQLPDMVDDGRCHAQAIHPPTQGWSLLWIMQKHDLGKEVPRRTLEFMYDGFSKWVDWFFLARDDDHDGLPQYDNGDEIGFDDCSPFEFETAMETPDLPAFLVLLCDAVSALAEILGRPDARDAWKKRGDELTQRLIETFWNGERFVALTNGDHRVVATDSVVYYLPLVLGKRLPQEIIDKMTADLLVEGDWLTPFGLCVEKLESDFFRLSGMSRGWVLPASNLLILTGMYNAGKKAEAKMIARRYCDACAEWGISMLLDPIRGTPNGFACSWSANTFLVLADIACNL